MSGGGNGPAFIMVLGGGVMQVPAIQIAKEKGWKVAVADGNRAAPGSGLADIFLHIDLKDPHALTEAARELKREGLQGVFTAGTDFSTSVAWIAAECGFPGIPYQAACRAKNKALMREAFCRAGVPSPDFVRISGGADCDEAFRRLSFPAVVKPVDNMGARGVKKIEGPEELREWFYSASGYSTSGEVLAEEYVPGPEFSLDAIVHGGRVDICGFADRHIRFSPYFVEMGHSMPARLPEKERQLVIDVFIRGIEAIGISEGAAKGDIKLTPRGAVVGEIAARLSGGYMSGWTYPYASGHEVTAAAMEVALGRKPSAWHPGYPFSSAERAFISIPGRVSKLSGIRKAKQVPYIKDLFLRTGEGMETVFPRNNIEKCGNVISQAAELQEAVKAAEEAASSVFIRLEPENRTTEFFLFSRNSTWPPSAFALAVKRNRDAFDTMPDYSAGPAASEQVLMLPDPDSEDGKEWHGVQFSEALRRVLSSAGERCGGRTIIPGKVFWKAFLRGGIQGGVWVLDTLRKTERDGGNPVRVIERWNEL